VTATAGATDVQHHRRHCLDQNNLENHRRTHDAIDIGRRDRALGTRHALGLVLHVCCTRAASIKIGDWLRAASGAQSARNQGFPALRFKITNGDEHYTFDSVVTQGTK
jgi:hypothetical protein